MVYRAAVKTGVVFKDGKNKARAKEFVAFLLAGREPHAVRRRLARPLVPGDQGGAGRARSGRPTRTACRSSTSSAAGTVTFEFTKNYKFTILNNENVWAKAMNRVVNDKVPVDKAVDEMIARIKAVAG